SDDVAGGGEIEDIGKLASVVDDPHTADAIAAGDRVLIRPDREVGAAIAVEITSARPDSEPLARLRAVDAAQPRKPRGRRILEGRVEEVDAPRRSEDVGPAPKDPDGARVVPPAAVIILRPHEEVVVAVAIEIANLELGSRHVAVAGALEREDRGLRGRRPDPDDAFDPSVSPDEVHAPARVTVALGTRACAHGREDEIDEPVAVEIAQSDGRASISASFAIGVDRPLAELLVVLEEPRARDRDRDADEFEPRQEKEKPGGRRKKPGPLSRTNDSHE